MLPGDDGDDAPLDEEISSLEAIFCSPGEIEVGAGGARSHSREVVIRLGSKGGKEEAPAGEVRLTVTVGPGYPSVPPSIRVSGDGLGREEAGGFAAEMRELAEERSRRECPYLLDLAWHVKERTEQLVATNASGKVKGDKGDDEDNDKDNDYKDDGQKEASTSSSSSSCRPLWVSVTRIDHMRDGRRYRRLLRDWTGELGLSGRLLMPGRKRRGILLMLVGEKEDIERFEKRHRTVNVDVDSRGHPCKERMLKLLLRRPLLRPPRPPSSFSGLQVVEDFDEDLKGGLGPRLELAGATAEENEEEFWKRLEKEVLEEEKRCKT